MKSAELNALINKPAKKPEIVVEVLRHYFGFVRTEAAELVNLHSGIFEARGTESVLVTAKAIITAHATTFPQLPRLTKAQRNILEHLAAGGTIERREQSLSRSVYEFVPSLNRTTRLSVLEKLREFGLITNDILPGRMVSGWLITSAGRKVIGV